MNAQHPLGQLIQSVEDGRGWSLREVARRIEREGKRMSNAYVATLKTKPIRSITYEMVQALAVGLDVPERIVALAALESMGVHDIGTAETGAAVAIARDPGLSDRDRRILLAVVREMQGERTDKPTAHGERSTAGSMRVDDQAQPDGVTPGAGDTNEGAVRQPDHEVSADDRPWEQDAYGLAAKRGRNRGREARDAQDRSAEDGGA